MVDFETSYKNLNTAQKKAVDTTEGPVMVVAGPGTGKTEVLALRIANILLNNSAKPDEVLCLTFTRSGVSAMRKRLERYIGDSSRSVLVSTFHSFAGDLIEKYYQHLDLDSAPKLLDDNEAVLIVDGLLHDHEWQYIRPRTNPSQYFGDLKGLISILKRERMSPEDFLMEVEKEITFLKKDPESISSRGESKGKIKKEVEKKIDSLERTKEVVEFYRLYENEKKQKGLMDYDDVLEYTVKLVEQSEDARDDIRENYQYILIDEHQDSSGVQNSFLKAVWTGVEAPNIFVVGDDRQLIYGFSGAKDSYFKEFGSIFGKTELIILVENYRSTEKILALADELLQSTVTKEKLKSNKKEDHPIFLSQYSYERDEILGAAKFFKQQISEGVAPEECALLVPKNRHVRSASSIFRDEGMAVSTVGGLSLFNISQTQSLIRILKIINNPFDSVSLSESLLDKFSFVEPLEAHTFLHKQKGRDFSISDFIEQGNGDLFSEENTIKKWGNKLSEFLEKLTHERLSIIISTIGNEILIKSSSSHEELLNNVEVIRSLLHSALIWEEKNPNGSIGEFLSYISRLEEYGQHIELASFGSSHGVQVMTLHKSKGLEYKCVWVAHMNEETIMAQKRQAFTLPESIKEHIADRNIESVKKELYVAITRAKDKCTISYAKNDYSGRDLNVAEMIYNLPSTHFISRSSEETERELLENSPEGYVSVAKKEEKENLKELVDFVSKNYESIKVSVTLLNNFFDCPWKWYFRNFLKLPEVKSVSLALGSAVHSTIEYILKQTEKPGAKELNEKIIYELRREKIHDEKELKRLAKDAISAINNWIEEYYPQLAKDKISERSVSFRDVLFPHLQMYGKIDLTERFPNGDITVTDFKTGGVKTSGIIEKLTDENRLSDLMRQLAMYSYLIKGAEKGTTVTNSRLLFVETDKVDKNKLYETHITGEQIDLLIRDIKEYDEQLKSGQWVNRDCRHKGYGDKSECEYCKLAKIFYK